MSEQIPAVQQSGNPAELRVRAMAAFIADDDMPPELRSAVDDLIAEAPERVARLLGALGRG